MTLQARIFNVEWGQPGEGFIDHSGDPAMNRRTSDASGESGSQVLRFRLESKAVHLRSIRLVSPTPDPIIAMKSGKLWAGKHDSLGSGGFNQMGTKLLEVPKRRVSVASVESDQ